MFFILSGFLVIALIDLVPVLKRRHRRELVAFLALFVPALTISVLQAMKVNIPSAMNLFGKVLKSIGLSY